MIPAALAAALSAAACGQIKDRPDHVITVQGDGSAASGDSSSSTLPDDLRKLQDLINLYTDKGSITKSGLANLINKYKDKIGGFLDGTGMTTDQIVEFLFQFDTNHDGNISTDEIVNALYKRIPILRWIPDNRAAIDATSLDADIAQEFPRASAIAREGLKGVLLRYDEKWAGGNGDGLLTRQELSVAGLLLGVLEQVDFSKGVPVPPGASDDQKLAIGLVNQKLNEQIYGRYPVADSSLLAVDDAHLEWMQLALRFYLCDKLVYSTSGDSLIAPPDQAQALAQYGYGPADPNHWAAFRQLYSNPLMGGQAGGWSTIVTFNVVTELDYAARIWLVANGDFSAQNISQIPGRDALLASLQTIYPSAGKGLFLADPQSKKKKKKDPAGVRSDYWDNVKDFDSAELGGNHDGKIDIGELALALGYARVIDGIYATYDTNHDGLMSKLEAAPLFKSFGIVDPRAIEVFYADIDVDGKGNSLWAALKIFFSGASKIDNLGPYEFHKRMIQILPHILNGEKP